MVVKGGEEVVDTPAEAQPSFGCPLRRDTCSAPGLDPVRNYMDFTDDSCKEEFTPGQISQMIAAWYIYRDSQEPKPSCMDGNWAKMTLSRII